MVEIAEKIANNKTENQVDLEHRVTDIVKDKKCKNSNWIRDLVASSPALTQKQSWVLYFNLNSVPEPSSVTMPNPSALFCLSNAFRSSTLKDRKPHKDILLWAILSYLYQNPAPHCDIKQDHSCLSSLTYMTAWVLQCSEKSQHHASLLDNPAFSVKHSHQRQGLITMSHLKWT